MAAIDLIVLGMLKKEPMGAYDIQKLVEYRNISKWIDQGGCGQGGKDAGKSGLLSDRRGGEGI